MSRMSFKAHIASGFLTMYVRYVYGGYFILFTLSPWHIYSFIGVCGCVSAFKFIYIYILKEGSLFICSRTYSSYEKFSGTIYTNFIVNPTNKIIRYINASNFLQRHCIYVEIENIYIDIHPTIFLF